MNHKAWEKLTKDMSALRNQYPFDRTRSCFLHLPYEQPDSQALLRLFFDSLPAWIKSNSSYRLISTSIELFYQNELEAIIGNNYRHFDYRIAFVIDEVDKKKIFISLGITIHDFQGWIYALPFHVLICLTQPIITRNMQLRSQAHSL